MMFREFLLCVCAAFMALSASAGVKYTINDNWLFYGNPSPYMAVRVNLPHTWNAVDATDDEPGYFRGLGRYKKNLVLPESIFGKRVFLNFEGANQVTKARINGRDLSKVHNGGYTSFVFDITPYVKAGDNEIEIFVDNSHNPAIPPLSADFTFFGGIYRDLYLEIEEPVHISHSDYGSSGIYIDVDDPDSKKVKVNVSTLIDNFEPLNEDVFVNQKLYDPDGALVGKSSKSVRLSPNTTKNEVKTRFILNNPQLWSPSSPNLYRVETEIVKKNSNKVLDTQDEQFGIRWFSFEPNKGFMLNGSPLKLVGTNRHQDFNNRGWAISDAHHKQDLEILKNMGGNFLRVSHYPQDPVLMELCDRMGIITSVEIPIVNAVTEGDDFLNNCMDMQREMIKQNYNHPSVVLWAYMNEVMLRPPYKTDDPKYEPYCKEVHRQAAKIDSLTRSLDSRRYTMIPLHNSIQPYEDCKLFNVPQVIGWNLYQGWYSGKFSDMEDFIDEYHAKYPDKPTLITEFGADCDTRLHSDSPQRFDYTMEYADQFHEHYLPTLLEKPYISGFSIWNLNEFYSENRGNAKPHVNAKGVIGLDRTPKNAFWFYKANLSGEPFVRFASEYWTNRAAQLGEEGFYETEVKLYTNRDKVNLTVNSDQKLSLPVENGIARAKIRLRNGVNRLVAVTDADYTTMHINLNGIPYKINKDFDEICVSLGAWYSYTDAETQRCWMPEQEYREGNWGYVGGEPMLFSNWAVKDGPFDVDILSTADDPLYQTARRGMEKIRFDVPDGKYAIYLRWADLDDADSCFDVIVNGKKEIEALDVKAQAGHQQALDVRVDADAHNGEGVEVAFNPLRGQAFLNAIRVVRR